nr:hypothetical protein [Candidatus Freyarchaeota archaeon]
MHRIRIEEESGTIVTVVLIFILLIAVFGGYLIIAGINNRIDQSNALATQAYTVAYEAYNKPPYTPYLYEYGSINVTASSTNVTINITQTGTCVSWFANPQWNVSITPTTFDSGNATVANTSTSKTVTLSTNRTAVQISIEVGAGIEDWYISEYNQGVNMTITFDQVISGNTWLFWSIEYQLDEVQVVPTVTILSYNTGANVTLGWNAACAPAENSTLYYMFQYAG